LSAEATRQTYRFSIELQFLIDLVVCWKLDRFGRSLMNCKVALQQLQHHGVRFILTSQNIDTDESNPAARFLLHIAASLRGIVRRRREGSRARPGA
jgi:DNA invertase Pin-like site-specific DNA recombinase